MKAVKFAYYDEFHCTGSECADTCCKDWHINLSKREYLDYKKMKFSPELKLIAENAFKRFKDGNDFRYAEMKLNEDGKCPFLNGDGLCKIQKEKGEEALSYTCSVFPRLWWPIGTETMLQACQATCSHVVELLMNHPEGLEIVESDYNGENKYAYRYPSNFIPQDCNLLPYYWEILNAQIDILQNRRFTVSERMLILGYFCQKTDEYIKNDNMGKIPSLASMLLDNELCGKIADSLKPRQSDNTAASKSMDILLKMNLRIQGVNLPQYAQMFDKVMNRLNYSSETAENGETFFLFSYAEYAKLCNIYRQIENDRPYIIENLLVNQAFIQNMREGIWINYFTLAVFYNMLKICVPVFLPEEYSDKELAIALTCTVKMLINTHLADQGTFLDFVEENMHTLPYAAFLIC